MIEKEIKSHFHITLSGVTSEELLVASKIIKSKPTIIDLHTNSLNISDKMTTGYQRGIGLCNLKDNVKKLLENNFNVIRAKLEADLIDYLNVFGCVDFSKNYVECHFHINNKDDVDGNIFRYSSNPSSNGKIFANYRAYNEADMNFIIQFCSRFENAHLELCVYDSNVAHDENWWNFS